jgi:alpha-beta hydrolase superfamily lysophospholipase
MTYLQKEFTTSRGIKLHIHQWSQPAATASVLIVHGYTEHAYRYDEFASHLVSEGIEVFAYDQRGHGRSEGLRAYIPRFEELVDDLGQVMKFLTIKKPLFLLGQSMGGLVVSKFCATHDTADIRGAILCAPALKLDDDLSPILVKIAPLIALFFPRLPTERLNANYLSRDQEVVNNYLNDPLVYTKGTRARTGSELIKAIKSLPGLAPNFKCALLILHGSADKITDPAGSSQFCKLAGSLDKEFKSLDGLYHDILHEPEKEELYQIILNWIRERTS